MGILEFKDVYVNNAAVAAGSLEKEGPLGEYFDLCEEDAYFGEKSWETAESEMVRRAVNLLFGKTKVRNDEIDMILGGDLLNQCTATSFAAMSLDIPFLGLYGACSTIAESILVSAAFITAKLAKSAVCVASSHFCSSERQYRYPLEFGHQRPPTAQNTVTAAGAFLVENKTSDIAITKGLVGKVIEMGIDDANNMGAAMAPAAADTLLKYFKESGESPRDTDIIATGDLGCDGYECILTLLEEGGLKTDDLKNRFLDCGMLIYDREKQNVFSGGSGCGCPAAVSGSYFLKKLRSGEVKSLILVGTGALLSPRTVQQKLPIPGIAHLIKLERRA